MDHLFLQYFHWYLVQNHFFLSDTSLLSYQQGPGIHEGWAPIEVEPGFRRQWLGDIFKPCWSTTHWTAPSQIMPHYLTQWSQVRHIYIYIYISKLTIIGSDNGLSPGWHQAIIWINAGILFLGALGTKFSEISIEIYTFSFEKLPLKMSAGKWQSFCLGLNVLTLVGLQYFVRLLQSFWIMLCHQQRCISNHQQQK